MADEPPKNPGGDELQLGPQVGPDARLFVRRNADHQEISGVMRPVREGENLAGQGLFSIEPKDPARGLYHVKDIQLPAAARGKPAQVATDAFRDGWDAVWGKQPVGQA